MKMKHVMTAFNGTTHFTWVTTTAPATGVLLPPWQDIELVECVESSTQAAAKKAAKQLRDKYKI